MGKYSVRECASALLLKIMKIVSGGNLSDLYAMGEVGHNLARSSTDYRDDQSPLLCRALFHFTRLWVMVSFPG